MKVWEVGASYLGAKKKNLGDGGIFRGRDKNPEKTSSRMAVGGEKGYHGDSRHLENGIR